MNYRDVEQLSSYLDGRLNPSDSARLETRLASDPALASTLDALRESRSLLRRMPKRRAPRNFTLTRKMVGLKPPLPRTYPLLRFATVAAAFLFAVSFLNLRPISLGASAPAPAAYGGGADTATEAPMLEMESLPATEPPVAPGEAPTEMALSLPAPTDDQNREAESSQAPAAKNAGETPSPARSLLTQWQIVFGVIVLIGVASMLIVQRLASRKWREK